MLLLGQLRRGELLDPDLLSDLLAELAALAQEFLVLLLDGLQPGRLESASGRPIDGFGLKQVGLAAHPLDDGCHPGEGLEVLLPIGEDVDGLLDRQGPDASQLPPHADAVAARLSRQAVHEDDPAHGDRSVTAIT